LLSDSVRVDGERRDGSRCDSIRRLRARYFERGPAALAHGNGGRERMHALGPATSERVVQLAKTTYAGCNDSHLERAAPFMSGSQTFNTQRASP
jgi:hypothetical protein